MILKLDIKKAVQEDDIPTKVLIKTYDIVSINYQVIIITSQRRIRITLHHLN